MFGYDWPRLHAALNDLPAALLFVTVLFELAAWITKRESLRAAALWTLWAGVIGGWAAVVAGLQAEEVIDHGEAIHELMEPHETLALYTMGVFTVVLVHKLVRRGNLPRLEERVSRAVSFAAPAHASGPPGSGARCTSSTRRAFPRPHWRRKSGTERWG